MNKHTSITSRRFLMVMETMVEIITGHQDSETSSGILVYVNSIDSSNKFSKRSSLSLHVLIEDNFIKA